MSEKIQFKHFFTINNGMFIWEDRKMFDYIKMRLEGKRGYAIIEEEVNDKSNKQLAYYFGGIIRQECMQSNDFAGQTEMDIHMYLLSSLRKHAMTIGYPDGSHKVIEVLDDHHGWNKSEWGEYISEVIAFLQVEHGIHPKSPDAYKYNKYWHKTQIRKPKKAE